MKVKIWVEGWQSIQRDTREPENLKGQWLYLSKIECGSAGGSGWTVQEFKEEYPLLKDRLLIKDLPTWNFYRSGSFKEDISVCAPKSMTKIIAEGEEVPLVCTLPWTIAWAASKHTTIDVKDDACPSVEIHVWSL